MDVTIFSIYIYYNVTLPTTRYKVKNVYGDTCLKTTYKVLEFVCQNQEKMGWTYLAIQKYSLMITIIHAKIITSVRKEKPDYTTSL